LAKDNRGFFTRLLEDRLHIRVTPNNNNELYNISAEKDDITVKELDSNIETSSLIDAATLQDFFTISQNRNNKYLGFEEMLQDPIIAAAVEMYADDATIYNDKGDVIWAEGEDPNIVDAANRLIKVLGLNEKAWRHIYSLCVYGDLYLRLYRQGDESDYSTMYNSNYTTLTVKPEDTVRKLEEYIEFVDNPACIFDLQNKDKTTGFIRVADTSQIQTNTVFGTQPLQTVKISDTIMYDRKAFIHISLAESINRNPELLQVDNVEANESNVYKIKSGKSILEDAYPVTQSLKLLEDSLLLNRLTKSAIVRLLQIEVGDMPKQEVTNLMHRFKNNLEQKMAIDKRTGLSKSYNSPGPMDNIVYSVTKDGKGAISVQNLGGDVNVKDIMDLDYFNNKKLAALKIPKQFLNFDSPEGIGGNGVSLTKISSRYAHTIKRIQNAYIQGITNLINYFFIDKKLDYVNKFTIKMVSPSTVEDAERSETLSNNINQVSDIMNLVGELPDETRLDILAQLFTEKLGLTDIGDIIQQYVDSQVVPDDGEVNEFEDNDVDNFSPMSSPRSGGFDNDFGGDLDGDNFDMDMDIDSNFETNEPATTAETEPTITPEV
jgi:hypothetical protein